MEPIYIDDLRKYVKAKTSQQFFRRQLLELTQDGYIIQPTLHWFHRAENAISPKDGRGSRVTSQLTIVDNRKKRIYTRFHVTNKQKSYARNFENMPLISME